MKEQMKSMTKELKIWRTNMWPYTEEENEFVSGKSKPDWDYDTYGHGA